MSQPTFFYYPFPPRLIRLRDAPFYLGMDKNRFNHEVRPSLAEIKIGQQGVAFDRIHLDVNQRAKLTRVLGKSKRSLKDVLDLKRTMP